jgi:pectate lyase
MKKLFLTLLSAVALMPAIASNNVAPWGWATCSDESGTAFTLSGGCFTDATTVTLQALGNNQSDDSQIKTAIATKDIIIFDGSNGDFILNEYIKISAKNKTLIGINNARLCTKFYLTTDDITYLKAQNLDGLSSTDSYTGTLPDGTEITCDKRAFFTKKAMMELQYQKTGAYSLPNKSGIFSIESASENIIIRNLSLIGPGAVDIDGVDLITNMGTHVWIDHCTFQDSQDGALDSKRCDWATYTYNYFYYTDRSYSHAYTCGCGWAEGQMTLHLTFASNIWGKGCMRRLPQCGDCYVHLVNNYHNCPGNSAGMTINDNCKALVENNYAAAGVNKPLTGDGSGRNITVSGNNFSGTSIGSTVTVPYQYTKIAAANVPSNLTGEEGAGATLTGDAAYILSTIPTATRQDEASKVYVFVKEDAHIGGSITEVGGITVTFDPSVTDWRSGGTGSDARTVDDVDLTGYYTQSDKTNAAPINIQTTQAGTLTIFLGGGVATNKSVNMTEGENGLTGKVLSTGVEIASGSKPATAIEAWDGMVYTLEANKTYKFFVGGTKWRLAGFRYVATATGISATLMNNERVNSEIYNLAGQRVAQPSKKGLYIVNGKTVVIK